MPKPKRTPPTGVSIEQLEHMTTHELADLLSNVVLLLRRMPNVTWQELQSRQNPASTASIEERAPEVQVSPAPSHSHVLLREELKNMHVPDLREIAKDLHMRVPKSLKKEDLINKILSRQSRQDYGHSEQYTIQNL